MPSLSGYNKIRLRTSEDGPYIEGPLAAAALPGMNMVMTAAASTEQRDTFTPGATAAGGTAGGAAAGPVKILCEDSLQGKTVFDTYATGDNGFIYACQPGDVIQVLALTAQTIAKGAALSADASGRWILATINARVEALEGSGGVALAADTLVRVRVF